MRELHLPSVPAQVKDSKFGSHRGSGEVTVEYPGALPVRQNCFQLLMSSTVMPVSTRDTRTLNSCQRLLVKYSAVADAVAETEGDVVAEDDANADADDEAELVGVAIAVAVAVAVVVAVAVEDDDADVVADAVGKDT